MLKEVPLLNMAIMCNLCSPDPDVARADEAYAIHYADYYTHLVAEREGRKKVTEIQVALKPTGICVSYPDAFCLAYKTVFEEKHEAYRKHFWNFFNDWLACQDGLKEKGEACSYHSESCWYHPQYSRHQGDPTDHWEKETNYEEEEYKALDDELTAEMWEKEPEDDAARIEFRDAQIASWPAEKQEHYHKQKELAERCKNTRCFVAAQVEKMTERAKRAFNIPDKCPPIPPLPKELRGEVGALWEFPPIWHI